MTLDQQSQQRFFWFGVALYFALFSFNSLATSTLAALVGTKWGVLTGQEKFLIFVAIAANWTGLILVFLQKSVARLSHGKSPLESGETERIARP